MKRKFTQKGVLLALALLAAMTTPAAGSGAAPGSAAPASQSSGGYPPSVLTTAAERAPAAVPTLTNHVGQPGDGTEQQLPLGVGLIGVGLLGLAIGLATLLAKRGEPAAAVGAYMITSATTPVPAQPGGRTRFTLLWDDRRGGRSSLRP